MEHSLCLNNLKHSWTTVRFSQGRRLTPLETLSNRLQIGQIVECWNVFDLVMKT